MKTNAKKSKFAIKAVKVDTNKRVIPSGASTKPRYWRVNVGKKITGTSKQRRFFETEREANEFIQSMTDTMPRKGTSAFTIPDKLAHEASALAKELESHKASLTDAVRFFIKHSPKFRTIKVNEVIQSYLNSRPCSQVTAGWKCRGRHRRQSRHRRITSQKGHLGKAGKAVNLRVAMITRVEDTSPKSLYG